MDIGIVVKEFPPDVIGGTETQTLRMARHLSDAGHDVTVYTKSYPEATNRDEPFRLRRLPTWQLNTFVSTLTFLLSAVYYLAVAGRDHDILQCMMIYPSGPVGFLSSRLSGTTYFAWIRGGDYYFMKENPVKRRMIRAVLEDTTVLVQTERIAEDVRSEFEPMDLRVLGNGVEVPETTADGDAIVFVGRLERQKGVDVLLEAVADLPNQRLVIIGDGSERKRLKSMADQLGIAATFEGEVSPTNVTAYLAEGRVFVLPAIEGEGLPNAMLEAMAVGLPVIVTDTGGVADGVMDGESGFVVPPGDVDALRDRLKMLCFDDERQKRMGATARAWVQSRYSWDTIISKLETIYGDVSGNEVGVSID